MVMLKECKSKECQNKLQQLQWKEQWKVEDHVKDGQNLNKMGIKNKRQAVVTDRREVKKTALKANNNNKLER